MGFSQGENDTPLALQFSTDRIKACVIDPKKYTKATDHLKLSEDIKDNLHIHLFHELCHWFHSLQDPGRKRKETEFRGEILDYPMGRTYFSESFKPKLAGKLIDTNNEGRLWYLKTSISFEEVRTILRAPYDAYYQEGDDLCENLYRLEIGAPLRYGHIAYDSYYIQDFRYNGDINVIRKIINTCTHYYLEYK